MRTLVISLLLSSISLWAQSGAIAIRNARIVDGTGAPAKLGTVVIENRRIVSVGANASIPKDAHIIDAAGATLLPGMFDLHTHLRNSGAVGQILTDCGKNLKTYLAAGVTS